MIQSTPNHANIVQNRSSEIAEVKYGRIQFEDGLTLDGGGTICVSDRPPSFLHHHNALEIGYCYDGYGVFMVGSEVYSFGPGDVSIINAGVPHIARSSNPNGSNWAFLYIDPYGFAKKFVTDSGVQLCSPVCRAVLCESENPNISTLAREVFAEMHECGGEFRTCASGLLIALLCKVSRLEPAEQSAHSIAASSPFVCISPALQMIAQNYSDEITVSQMAQACCISEPQLRRLFLRAVGQSPVAYLSRFRLGMAISLLENSELSILQIANEVGYISSSSFYRHFTTEFGKSPREWRKERYADVL